MCVDQISHMDDLGLDGSPLTGPMEGPGTVCIFMMKQDHIPVVGTERKELGVDLTDGAVTDQEIHAVHSSLALMECFHQVTADDSHLMQSIIQ